MKQESKYLRAQLQESKYLRLAQNFGWDKMFDFRRAKIFCLRCCLLKHKLTRYSKNVERLSPSGPPGYAYVRAVYITYVQGRINHWATGQMPGPRAFGGLAL